MIAIPNMGMPKRGEVIAFDGEYAVYTDDRMNVHRYPLIDIVTCGECKWYNPWHANHTNIDGNHCRNIDRPMKPTDFCSYGGRRANDNTD